MGHFLCVAKTSINMGMSEYVVLINNLNEINNFFMCSLILHVFNDVSLMINELQYFCIFIN